MKDTARPPGKTTIAPDVLLTIAKLSALSVKGVARMSSISGGFNRFFKRGTGDGVRIEVENGTVFADLYVVMDKDVNIRDVSRNIQHEVSRAISELVGMDVGRINIHIDDINYSSEG